MSAQAAVSHPAAAYRSAIEPIADLHARRTQAGEWDGLMARLVEPSPFYAPDFLAASSRHLERAAVLAVTSRDAAGRLVGLLPFRPSRRSETGPLPAYILYANPYTPLTIPLIDRADPVAIAASLLAGLAQQARLPRLLILPASVGDGPAQAALLAAAAALARSTTVLRSHQRAVLQAGDTISADRLKTGDKLLKRAGKSGALSISTALTPDAENALLDAFLRIEASGWKGAAGTALASRSETLAFARAAFHSGAPILFDTLALNGAIVAMNLNLVCGDAAYAVKSGYDERFGKLSPGVLLDHALTTDMLRGIGVRLIDSCAIPGHGLERLWPSRRRIDMLAIDCGRTPSPAAFRLACGMQRQLLHWRERARGWLDRWRAN
jgi:CelD/BcsL family acetyltransferase involved in cellulose biosynthesis